MSILTIALFVLIGIAAVVVCIRGGKLVVKAINRLFDKIEEKIG